MNIKTKKKKKENIKEEKEKTPLLPEGIKRIIIGTLLLLIALIVGLGFCGVAGRGGEIFNSVFEKLFGRVKIIVPFLFFLSALVYFKTKYENFIIPLFVSLFVILTGFSGIVANLDCKINGECKIMGEGTLPGLGGFWGKIINNPLSEGIGDIATRIVFLVVIIMGSLIITNLINNEFSISEFFKELFSRSYDIETPSTVRKIFLSSEEKQEKKKEEIKEKKDKEEKKEVFEMKKKGENLRLIPPLELLHNGDEEPDPGDTKRNAFIIKKTFSDFDIAVSMGEINVGPTVTQYTLKPAEGVKLSRITSLSDDLALSLAMHPIRTEAPIPGKSLVGVEVPNRKRAQITLGSLIKRKEYFDTNALTFAVGLDVSGRPIYADLAKMPHMLVAGSTGSGKTIFLNTLLISLLYKNSPDDLRLILVDPKRVEFSLYANIPHLLTPIIYDAEKTTAALSWMIGEMERRFKVLASVGSRNISGYHDLCKKNDQLESMPYIVLIVDELADLMATKGNEMEGGIVRIAQMARAVGIHLVLATQRPSVEVITGLIKANITARASFRVASQVDSRTILDMAGAEKLLGSGDMLFLSTESPKPKRAQSPFISEQEAKGIVSWLVENGMGEGNDPLAENMEEALEKSNQRAENFDVNEDEDVLYEDAKQVVMQAGKASASLLQRRLRVGYARAARLLDILESNGVVGPAEGAKPREVFEKSEEGIEFGEEENEIIEEETEEEVEEENNDPWEKI
jgi:S-DNA-T family DNA segregation ATPase FtsK/SpoIIIE